MSWKMRTAQILNILIRLRMLGYDVENMTFGEIKLACTDAQLAQVVPANKNRLAACIQQYPPDWSRK